ncbi:hypothetical protein SDC9_138745 [bioreactor metagenome]|uniref:Uncharacterized protein n=1 Tax=bioreactor metagenome TaxID=1076179 RepID=A0A645DQ69_9ZZZZ
MRDKNKITVVLFFKEFTDQLLLFRLKIIGVLDSAVIFIADHLFSIFKSDTWDLINLRNIQFQHFNFTLILSFQQIKGIFQKTSFNFHQFRKIFNVAHLKIKACIFIQMTGRTVFFCTKNRTYFIDTFENADHRLLVKLGTLCKECFPTEIFHLKDICTALSGSRHKLRRMDFSKILLMQIISKSFYNPILNAKFCFHKSSTKRRRSVIELRIQIGIELSFIDNNRHRLCRS